MPDRLREALESVKLSAQDGTSGFMGNVSPFELEVYYRLHRLKPSYRYDPAHADAWRHLLHDPSVDVYARLCAAYFLLDHDDAARTLVLRQVQSRDPAARNNAVKIVQMHVRENPGNRWGIDLMIDALASGKLDGRDGPSSCKEGQCDGMNAPIDAVCSTLGFLKERRAVTELIALLSRQPAVSRAAFALGEIGDVRATPILMTIVESGKDRDDEAVIALGKLKAEEAVPTLIARLGHPRSTFSGLDLLETERLLEALRDIGDSRSVPAIRKYLTGNFPAKAKAVARRVLAQLVHEEPSAALAALLRDAPDDAERCRIIADLGRRDSDEAVAELVRIARIYPSAILRRDSIKTLGTMRTQSSLLALCDLLTARYPEHLRADSGWKGEPPRDFSRYFPALVVETLRQATGQPFGAQPAPWRAWIVRNVDGPSLTPRSPVQPAPSR